MVEASLRLPRPKGRLLFGYTLLWLVVLSGLAVMYLQGGWVRNTVAQVPVLGVGWWGAIGGVVANFETIHRRGDRWHPKDAFWYYARPFLAALFGGVGYVIYISLVQASLNGPDSGSAQRDGAPTGLGYVLAFALGMREQTFRDLVKRVFDLLATASGGDVEPPSVPPEFEVSWSEESKAVRLEWGHSTDNKGVDAYNVYRDYVFLAAVRPYLQRTNQKEDDGEATPKPPPLDRVTFVDQHPGGHGYYSVTAVDGSGNESVPAGPRQVRV